MGNSLKRSLFAKATLLGAFAVTTPVAFAQAKDPAAAEALFRQGLESLKAEDWDAACKAFDASMKLDPSVGAQINVARCAQHNGLLARAWAEFKKAKALNAETPLAKRKANVDSYVDTEIEKLEALLPWVTIKLQTSDGAPLETSALPGLSVERDGASLPLESLGASMPVDPGKHLFRASAPGYQDTTLELTFAPGAKQEALLRMVVAPPQPKSATSLIPAPPEPVQTQAGDETNPLLWAGIAVGAAGVGGLLVSAVTGGVAQADRNRLDELVDAGNCSEANGTITCDSQSKAEARSAIARGESLALVSTVTLFVGAGIAATGVVLLVIGATDTPKASSVGFAPMISPDLLGGMVGGSF